MHEVEKLLKFTRKLSGEKNNIMDRKVYKNLNSPNIDL